MPRFRQIVLSLLLLTQAAIAALSPPAWAEPSEDDYDAMRDDMVRKHIESGIFGRTPVRDPRVLAALRKVPRHKFVPDEIRDDAYADSALPIGHGQTISQPYIVATMTASLKLDGTEKVLEIGTGSGYQAAVLGELASRVYTIEIVEPLGERARTALKELGYDNVHVRVGDGYRGWPEEAPFDAIIVTAAPSHIPQPLIDQLAPGGRMVIPVGPTGRVQSLRLIEKDDRGEIQETELEAVRFVPFTGEAEQN